LNSLGIIDMIYDYVLDLLKDVKLCSD